jgi:acyl carrier protein
MSNIQQRLVKCFQIVFPDLPESRIPEATQSSMEAWDSIAAITLANIVSEEFGIPVNFEKLGEMNSFDATRQWVIDEMDGQK